MIEIASDKVVRSRVMLALLILDKRINVQLDEEELAVIKEFREVRDGGYGRLEVRLVNGQIESCDSIRHKKRKDLNISPHTT